MKDSLKMRSITPSFDCPFCGVKGCCVAQEEAEGEMCVIHPMPPCEGYMQKEPHEIVAAVNAKLRD